MKAKWIYLIMILVLAYFAGVIFIPLLLSIYSAMLIDPFVSKLEKKGIPRHAASFLVMVVFLIVVVVAGWLIYLSFSSLTSGIAEFPGKIRHLMTWVNQISQRVDMATQTPNAQNADVQKVQMVTQYPEWAQYVLKSLGSLYDIISIALFVPLFLFYFLYDKELLLNGFNQWLEPSFSLKKINSELPKMIRAFALANLATLGFLLLTHGVTLYFLKFNHWLALSVTTALASLIPIVGSVLALFLPVSQGLASGTQTYPYLIMAVVVVSLHIIANSVILPQVAGLRINVNSATMLLGILFWGWFWGGMGFILAVPLTATVKIFLESNPETVPLSNLMAARPTALKKA